MIRADKLEKQWSEIVSGIQLPEDWRRRIEELAGDADERETILQERAETKERLRRMTRLYQDLLIDDQEYRETLERLRSHLTSLILPENPRLIEVGNYLEKLRDLWTAASLEERRDLTRIIVRSVVVNVKHERIVGIEPVGAFRLLLDEICEDMELELVDAR
jgi:Xaa-Pro aminopeptidase